MLPDRVSVEFHGTLVGWEAQPEQHSVSGPIELRSYARWAVRRVMVTMAVASHGAEEDLAHCPVLVVTVLTHASNAARCRCCVVSARGSLIVGAVDASHVSSRRRASSAALGPWKWCGK